MSVAHPTARGTAALLAVLAALGAYLALAERPRPPAPHGPPALLGVPATAVARVDVDGKDGPLAALRGPDGWKGPDGHPWPGDAVDDLLETLASLPPLMVVDPDPHAPGDYGLGDGAARVEMHAADGRRLLGLEVGERNPAWTGVYVRRAGEPEVMLVGAVLAWELEKVRAAAPGP